MTTTSGADLDGLVEAVATLRWSQLGERTRRRSALVFADTVGAIMAGARTPELGSLVERGDLARVGLPGPAGCAQVLVPGFPRLPVGVAAFVNGTAAVAAELDECAPGNGGHAAAHVVPAALAVAQARGRSGADLLGAVVAGYEVAARLGHAHEWHPAAHGHGHVGTVGAAVACAMLDGGDPVGAARVAANLPLLTVQQACLDGATARNGWVGASALLALLAGAMALAGFTGSAGARERALGELMGQVVRPAQLAGDVAESTLRITRSSAKFHSACYETHAALDAALTLAPVAAETVARVLVEMPVPYLTELPNGTSLSNRFSVPYGVAAALVHGHAGPAAFEPDPAVMGLARRVTVRAWAGAPGDDAARITLTTAGGETLGDRRCRTGGTTDQPGADDLEEKFRSISGAPRPGELFRRLLATGEVADVAALFDGIGGRRRPAAL